MPEDHWQNGVNLENWGIEFVNFRVRFSPSLAVHRAVESFGWFPHNVR